MTIRKQICTYLWMLPSRFFTFSSSSSDCLFLDSSSAGELAGIPCINHFSRSAFDQVEEDRETKGKAHFVRCSETPAPKYLINLSKSLITISSTYIHLVFWINPSRSPFSQDVTSTLCNVWVIGLLTNCNFNCAFKQIINRMEGFTYKKTEILNRFRTFFEKEKFDKVHYVHEECPTPQSSKDTKILTIA